MLDMKQFHGRLNDLDSHIQPSLSNYEVAAGETGRNFANAIRGALQTLPPDAARKLSGLIGDESSEFTEETVWKIKGASAPGSFTPEGRLRTLDLMGVRRALIFSDPGIQAASFAPGELGVATMRHWNDFALRFGGHDRDRLRVAALLNTHDIDVATAEVERVLAAGGRAFVFASSVAPGQLSPAHERMDRIWGMISEARATALLHIGGEHGFMGSDAWARGVDHLEFQPHDFTSETEQINTYTFASFHYAPQNFISTLVLGGVFERFPDLRFGAIELGAGWLAPMAERLDQVASLYARRLAPVLSLRPSEYIRRNIRVTPFRIEPVATYIDRYGFDECYCFSSDFPHPEGGVEPLKEFRQNIERLGQGAAEKLFVKNAEWVLPALSEN
ncbi:amidohydrolase family protein [Sorangium sp. So ce136]|uniref:amidohydrolase family protein n=1 Tax=Sorangium sp. So ce136 TaxID=3133284 RepID=UPI003EFCCE9C